MKKAILKALSLTLCLASFIGVLASCKKDGNATTSTPVDNPGVTDTQKVCPIEKQDFGGTEFNVLCAGFSTPKWDFTYAEENGSVIDDAIFERNALVEEHLGIKIVATDKKTTSTSGSTEGLGALRNDFSSGDCTYNAVILPAYDMSPAAYQGYLCDLNKIDTFNLDAEYWDQNSVNSLTIKNMLYYCSGDYSYDNFNATECIVFNKDIAKQKGINDLYELVDSGKWTLEKWKEYTKLVSEDLNGDGYYTDLDLYGSIIWDDAIYAVVHSTGERCCTLDDNGNLVLSLNTERMYTAFEDFVSFATEKSCLRFQQKFGQNGSSSNDSNSKLLSIMFPNDQALFALTTIGQTTFYFREMDTDYGILPYFKYTEDQDKYYNTVAPYNVRFFGMPVNQEDEVFTASVMETVSFYSNQTIIPAYYEHTLVGKTVRDDESLPVLELMRLNRVYDVGYYYQPGNINKHLIYNFRAYNKNWMSTYEQQKNPALTQIDLINSSFDKLVSEG